MNLMQILGQRLPDLIPAAVQIGGIEFSLYPATPKFNYIGGRFSWPTSKRLGRSGRQRNNSSAFRGAVEVETSPVRRCGDNSAADARYSLGDFAL
jgi:hypothetical protein